MALKEPTWTFGFEDGSEIVAVLPLHGASWRALLGLNNVRWTGPMRASIQIEPRKRGGA